MGMKSMKGERREQFGDFTKRAENADRHSLRTYIHYSRARSGPARGGRGRAWVSPQAKKKGGVSSDI